jgi:hypothetical protein
MALLLASTDLSISEATRSAGWSDPFYASRCAFASAVAGRRPGRPAPPGFGTTPPPSVLVGGGLCSTGGGVSAVGSQAVVLAGWDRAERVGAGDAVAVAVGGGGADLLIPSCTSYRVARWRPQPPHPGLALFDGMVDEGGRAGLDRCRWRGRGAPSSRRPGRARGQHGGATGRSAPPASSASCPAGSRAWPAAAAAAPPADPAGWPWSVM